MVSRIIWLLASLCGAAIMLIALNVAPRQDYSPDVPDQVIISEVAWAGTAADSAYEWIELHNRSDTVVDITGWRLTDDNDIDILLNGSIEPDGFYLLEHLELSVMDIQADQLYLGFLDNAGERLYLYDDNSQPVDSANENGGDWPAGEASSAKLTMERSDRNSNDDDLNWHSNDTQVRNGLDANFQPINGTPDHPNSGWNWPAQETDLTVNKTGPLTATAGSTVQFTIRLTNSSRLTATEVAFTDTLPADMTYLSSDGDFSVSQPFTGVIVWHVGIVPTATAHIIHMTATVDGEAIGQLENTVVIGSAVPDENLEDNEDSTIVVIEGSSPNILLDAVHYYGYSLNEKDEAVRLINVGLGTVDLSGWRVTDERYKASFPAGTRLGPGQILWAARRGKEFTDHFGFKPDFEVDESDPEIPNLSGSWPRLNDNGDTVVLLDHSGTAQDVLVFGSANPYREGWSGPALWPYTVEGVFFTRGQILYRMRDLNSGLPIGDTNTSSDWAQSRVDPVRGRRVQYPGWDLDTFFFTRRITETAEVVIGIAPDNAFDLVNGEIENANESLLIATHTFRNHAIANTLVKAAERGVSVTVLMEGNPVQGIDDQQKLICKSLEAAGGQCWFMISDSDRKIYDRYTYYHAKYMLIDGRRVIISTENLSPDSLPDDDKDDGTWGRRGLVFVTNAPGIVDHIGNLWLADFDPINHSDLYRWTASHPKYGLPPPSTIPISQTGGDQYAIRYQTPFTYQGQFTFEVIQSPENSLRSNDSLLGLLSQAGPDDVVLVQQLEEYPYWGSKSSNPTEDPNPRLLAYIDAARRGAKVRLLLDGYFGNGSDVKSNQATCRLVNNIAIVENLDLICRLGNPTGLGIHNKMILVQVKGLGFVHLGSLNGSEQASKGNREVAIQFQIDLAYADLSEMFYFDWPKRYYLPIVFVDG